MKAISSHLIAALIGAAGMLLAAKILIPTWSLAYAHDEAGQALAGSKQRLIEAVRAGKLVRVYFAGRRVEHLTDSHFLTVFGGEVFAQIAPIQTQAPSMEPPKIEFREPGRLWRAIIGTDGSFRGYADGNDPGQRQSGARWFVQQ